MFIPLEKAAFGEGLLNVVGNEPIPTSPGLVMGLSSPNFGVFNCDQTSRIRNPVALAPTYFDAQTGDKLTDLYVACVIDLEINASLSYHPNHIVCNGEGNTKVLLFTRSNEIYLFDKEGFKDLDLSENKADLRMNNITAKVHNPSNLKTVLAI